MKKTGSFALKAGVVGPARQRHLDGSGVGLHGDVFLHPVDAGRDIRRLGAPLGRLVAALEVARLAIVDDAQRPALRGLDDRAIGEKIVLEGLQRRSGRRAGAKDQKQGKRQAGGNGAASAAMNCGLKHEVSPPSGGKSCHPRRGDAILGQRKTPGEAARLGHPFA